MTAKQKETASEWARWGFSQIAVPLLVATFAIGGMWATMKSDSDAMAARHGINEEAGHPIITSRLNAQQKQIDIMSHNIGVLCIDSGSKDCKF